MRRLFLLSALLAVPGFTSPAVLPAQHLKAFEAHTRAALDSIRVKTGDHRSEGFGFGALIGGTLLGAVGSQACGASAPTGPGFSQDVRVPCRPNTPEFIALGVAVGGTLGWFIGRGKPKYARSAP